MDRCKARSALPAAPRFRRWFAIALIFPVVLAQLPIRPVLGSLPAIQALQPAVSERPRGQHPPDESTVRLSLTNDVFLRSFIYASWQLGPLAAGQPTTGSGLQARE